MTITQIELLIVGGGAAGVMIAMQLGPLQKKHNFSITLVDTKTFYEYTPALVSVLFNKTDSGFKSYFERITVDYQKLLSPLGVKFVLGRAVRIEGSEVILAEGKSLSFTYLIICTGSTYPSPWKVSSSSLNGHVTLKDRYNALLSERRLYEQSGRILCIGGGPVAVEIAGEISRLNSEKAVWLVHSKDTLLNTAPSQVLGKAAKKVLESRSVTIILGERAEKLDDTSTITQDDDYEDDTQQKFEKTASPSPPLKPQHIYHTSKTNTIISADRVYACTGAKPNSDIILHSPKLAHLLDDRGRIKVNARLQLEGQSHMFAIGDVNNVEEEKMFFTAHMQALLFVKNFRRILEAGQNSTTQSLPVLLEPYHGTKLSMFVSLGPDRGVAYTGGLVLSGWSLCSHQGSRAAALGKRIIELITMDVLCLKKPVNDLLFWTQHKGPFFKKVLCLNQNEKAMVDS